jgi:sortase A
VIVADRQSPGSATGHSTGILRVVTGGLGELFMTAGVVLLLFCTYQLFWTNVAANRAAHNRITSLRSQWDSRAGEPDPLAGVAKQRRIPLGANLAILYIPRFGKNWVAPVVEGVELGDLKEGVGHYPRTAIPGAVGNFAIAGHRATNGEPFRDMDKLRPGDLVIVETKSTWFIYRMKQTIIVAPTAVDVVLPVPRKPNSPPTEKLLTLTTCNPRWASTERMVVFGTLGSQLLKTNGTPPELVGLR